MKLPQEMREALDQTGLSWEIEPGKKHNKVKLAGRLVAVYPYGKEQTAYKRALLNSISQIRRAAQELRTQ